MLRSHRLIELVIILRREIALRTGRMGAIYRNMANSVAIVVIQGIFNASQTSPPIGAIEFATTRSGDEKLTLNYAEITAAALSWPSRNGG